jgi:hypothetical protein
VLALAQLRVQRVDRGAGHAEGLRHAFLLHHQHGGHRGLHLCHVGLLIGFDGRRSWGARRGVNASAHICYSVAE